MTDPVVTCGECGKPYRHEVNILTNKPVFLRARGCKHPFGKVLVDGKPPASVRDGGEVPAGILKGKPR